MKRDAHVSLHIDDIVLHGFEHIDRHALTAALEQALSERMASFRPDSGAVTGEMRASLSLPAHAGSAQIGTALAGVIGDAISAHATNRGDTHG